MSYGFMMVGNAVSSAIRTGEWAWASALLDEWLANEITGGFYLELYVDRAILTALTGGDPEPDLAAAERLLPDHGGRPAVRVVHAAWGRAWQAFAAGRPRRGPSRGRVGGRGDQPTSCRISLPLAGRAALWVATPWRAASAIAVASTPRSSGARRSASIAPRCGPGSRPSRVAAPTRSPAIATRCAAGGSSAAPSTRRMAALDLAILLAPTEREMAEARAPSRAPARRSPDSGRCPSSLDSRPLATDPAPARPAPGVDVATAELVGGSSLSARAAHQRREPRRTRRSGGRRVGGALAARVGSPRHRHRDVEAGSRSGSGPCP